MGLGLQTAVSLRRARFGILQSVVQPEEIADALLKCTRQTPLEDLASILQTGNDQRLSVRLHPAAEPVCLDIDDAEVMLSAKTSNVGPGYHAFLVDCLDRLQKQFGFAPQWNEENRDETGYFEHREFGRLQQTMAEHVRFLFAAIDKQYASAPGSRFAISMPIDFGVMTPPDAATTPIGPMTRSRIAEIGILDQVGIIDFCVEYLPWWNRDFDAAFFAGLARNSIWLEHRWAKPVDAVEREFLAQTRNWIAKAKEGGCASELLDSANEELESLLSSATAPIFPRSEGPGYRRQKMRFGLTGRWEITAPGSLIEDSEDDGSTVVLWNDAITLRASSFTGKLKEAAAPADDSIEREITFEPSSEGDGYLHQTIAKTTSMDGDHQRCIVTIWMRDSEFRTQADDISATIRYVNQESPTG